MSACAFVRCAFGFQILCVKVADASACRGMGRFKVDVKAHMEHVETCEDASCFRCRYLMHREAWTKTLPWLVEKSEGEWGLLCSLCVHCVPHLAFGQDGFRGPGTFNALRRHESSKQHQTALQMAFGADDPFSGWAPSKDEFEKFASSRLTAASLRAMDKKVGLGGRWKLGRLQNCLGQACQRLDCAFLLSSEAIALHQDVRRLVLMIRYRACNYNLETRTGLMGIFHLEDSTSASLVLACESILWNFVEEDAAKYDALRHKVILINADAAPDEQLAGRLMQTNEGLYPSAKAVTRDRCHAARRLLQRPFKAVPVIWETFSALVWGSQSMPSTIQSSDVLRAVFNKYTRATESTIRGDRIKSLSLRKQRFDSHQKVTGRLCLWLEATVMTAIYAATFRRGERDGDRAVQFLRDISEEKMLLLAMVADFSDEATSVIRMMDTEDSDIAGHVMELDSFASRVKHLFVDEKATGSGYTKFVLEQLEKRIVSWLHVCHSGVFLYDYSTSRVFFR